MRILISAGGTREYIDPVRFISNASTGKMGYAIAMAAQEAGHDVVLISAPVSMEKPIGVEVVDVVSAADMFEAVSERFDECDCLIMAAAVSDYTVAQTSATKIKKNEEKLTIELRPTIDILKWAGGHKRNQIIVGFALEDQNLLDNAQDKMILKNMDMIVANTPAAISANNSEVHIRTTDSGWMHYPLADKNQTAKRIVELVEQIARKH